MKKFIFFLLFLIAAGGTGFFFGWTKLSIPPGSYGVMRSKTHGLETQVIRDGEIRWLWYKLIPKNVTISVYSIDQVKHPVRSSGSLKSGNVYASLAGIEADFSWNINGELIFNINPEFLPEFTARENINNDADLRRAEERLADRIGSMALQRIVTYIENEDEGKIEPLFIGAPVPELETEIYRAFPEIENLSCTIQVSQYPDFALYRSVKTLYQEYMARQTALLRPDIAREAENRLESRMRMDDLTKYGELLTRFPILLQYLALEKGLVPGSVE